MQTKTFHDVFLIFFYIKNIPAYNLWKFSLIPCYNLCASSKRKVLHQSEYSGNILVWYSDHEHMRKSWMVWFKPWSEYQTETVQYSNGGLNYGPFCQVLIRHLNGGLNYKLYQGFAHYYLVCNLNVCIQIPIVETICHQLVRYSNDLFVSNC